MSAEQETVVVHTFVSTDLATTDVGVGVVSYCRRMEKHAQISRNVERITVVVVKCVLTNLDHMNVDV